MTCSLTRLAEYGAPKMGEPRYRGTGERVLPWISLGPAATATLLATTCPQAARLNKANPAR